MIRLCSFWIASLVLVGCSSSSQAWFEGVGPEGSTAPEVRYTLQSAQGVEGAVTVELTGIRNDELDGRNTDTARVRLTVDNRSDAAIEIPLAHLALEDDEQRRYQRIESNLPAGSSTDFALVPARVRSSLEILFDAGGPRVLRTTGSLSLIWSYRFRGEETPHRTRFLPVRYRVATVYRTSLYYGPSWCW